MIIVRLNGGLGNQMFQYAAGRRAALAHKTILKLDRESFDSSSPVRRGYSLGDFAIQAEIATKKDLERVATRTIRLPWDRRRNTRYIKEKHFHFDPQILKLPDNSYLDGYWQSEKYFLDCEKIIRRDLKLESAIGRKATEILQKVKNSNSVSLHVRRGDYAKSPHTRVHHGLLPSTYYQQAMSLISKALADPIFFVFSDDPGWVRRNLKITFPAVIVSGQTRDFEDLMLMSACRQHIIANSSFSWWGAWLNRNPNKIVVAPKRWFREKSIDTSDLIPDDWLRI